MRHSDNNQGEECCLFTADATDRKKQMKNRRNYYRILQVQPDAPLAVIRASYKALMRELQMHPDLGGDHWNASILNDAYETLSDPTRRTTYDQELFKRYTKLPFEGDKNPLISYFCPFCKRPFARKANFHEACPSCRSPLVSDSDSSPKQNQRAVERVKKSGQVRFYRDWPLKPTLGEIIDLSPQGMCFQCHDRLTPNMVIKISSRDLKAVAVVRSTYKIIERGTTMYSVGIEFLSVQFSQPKGSFHSALV